MFLKALHAAPRLLHVPNKALLSRNGKAIERLKVRLGSEQYIVNLVCMCIMCICQTHTEVYQQTHVHMHTYVYVYMYTHTIHIKQQRRRHSHHCEIRSLLLEQLLELRISNRFTSTDQGLRIRGFGLGLREKQELRA